MIPVTAVRNTQYYLADMIMEMPALHAGKKKLSSEEFMEDGHLASLGSLLHRGFGRLRLFILDLILIGFFRPERGYRLPFGNHGICRYRSFLTGGWGKAGIGQGPVLSQPCPAPGAEVRLQRKLLPAVMTELGDFRRLFMDRRS